MNRILKATEIMSAAKHVNQHALLDSEEGHAAVKGSPGRPCCLLSLQSQDTAPRLLTFPPLAHCSQSSTLQLGSRLSPNSHSDSAYVIRSTQLCHGHQDHLESLSN